MPLRPHVPPEPPANLPAGLVGVWRAVREAAIGTGRADLSRRLGVSTHTLQSILVDGDVPDFRRASLRQVRSWTRTLCRLASRLGRDPRPWIEAAGIPWDEATQAIARRAAAPAPRRGRVRSSPVGLTVVEVGIAEPARLPCLPGTEPPLLRLACRLVAALDPSVDILVRHTSASRLLDDATAETARPFLVAGVLDSARLHARGFERLAIPGWQPAIAALHVRARGASAPRAWSDLARDGGREAAPFVVQRAEAAESLVHAHWGVPPGAIRAVDAGSAIELARALLRARREEPDHRATLVADEATCRAVHDVLRAESPEESTDYLAADEGEAPRFPLVIAMPARRPGWSEAAGSAWRDEIFGSARTATAALYAEILHAGCRGVARLEAAGPAPRLATDRASAFRPLPFPAADDAFQRVLARELLAALFRERGLDEVAAARDPAGATSLWDDAFARAHAVVPGEWRATLDAMAWAARRDLFARSAVPLRPLHEHCRSCSQPLREYPGPSARYCRFCADDEGRLRPRTEVLELIAEWMESWQGELPHDRALERAARYMSAMPAWSEN